MSQRSDLIALRQQLLVARARLQRVQLLQDALDTAALCRPSSLAAAAAGAATSHPWHWLGSAAGWAGFAWRTATWLSGRRARRDAPHA